MHPVISALRPILSWFGFGWLIWIVVQRPQRGGKDWPGQKNQLQISFIKKNTTENQDRRQQARVQCRIMENQSRRTLSSMTVSNGFTFQIINVSFPYNSNTRLLQKKFKHQINKKKKIKITSIPPPRKSYYINNLEYIFQTLLDSQLYIHTCTYIPTHVYTHTYMYTHRSFFPQNEIITCK